MIIHLETMYQKISLTFILPDVCHASSIVDITFIESTRVSYSSMAFILVKPVSMDRYILFTLGYL